jgi:tetratricopeptide (TPR) repeat protein
MTATLAHLKDSPPDGIMTQLLTRTKDARALPLLLDQLEKANGDRSAVINLLVQIGDQSVADKLAQKYPTLQNNTEKVHVLNGLRQFRHARFREFAGAALLSNDSSLVSTAANTLIQDGHPEGEKLLIAALDKQTTSHLLHSITNALANYGTPDARAALVKAKQSSDVNKRNYATIALTQIRQRSPGFQYVAQARQRLETAADPNDKDARKQQEKEALELLETALQLDSQIPEAYATRGKILLRQEKLTDAGKDFEKALELAPDLDDGEVITGLGLARVTAGKLDDAIKLVEAGREKQKNVSDRGLYAYNTACVYSRSMQYLQEHPDVADSAKKIEEYRKKALSELDQSIKKGFPDFDWMAKDPDFKALRDDAEFKKLLAMKPAEKPDSE